MSQEQTHRVWVAYGPSGVVGAIREDEHGYTVTKAGADRASGVFETLEAAKGALHAGMPPGTEWPTFRRH